METIGTLKAVLCALILKVCESTWVCSDLTVGPRSNEKGVYVYEIYTSAEVHKKHCRYCPEGSLDNTPANEEYQEFSCITKYDNIKNEIKTFEYENRKIPICKKGEVPGCGSPPEEKMTDDYEWSCDPGFNDANFSVYFSCALVFKTSGAVAWSYYCNEDLKWELDSSISQQVVCTEYPADGGDAAAAPAAPARSCGPPPEEKMSDDYEWSCDPGLSKVNFSVNFSCALVCKKSRAVAWSYYCTGDLTWELGSSVPQGIVCTEHVPTDPSDDTMKTELIIISSCGTSIVIGCLVVFVVWIFQKRKRRLNDIKDVEAITKSDARCSPGNNTARQPTYGEERPASIGSQKEDDEQTLLKSQSNLENPSTEESTHVNPSANHCSQLDSQCHTISGERDNSQTSLSSVRNTDTGLDIVRAEFQQSLVSNGRIGHLYQNPSYSPLTDNRSSVETKNLFQINPSDDLNVSKDMTILTKKSTEGKVEGMSSNERPNPQGNISMSTYTESGYFDDENDTRHNTNPKEVA